MAEVWKQWEDQVVDSRFPLLHYLGGSEHSAVFLTERGELEPEKVVIKLVPVTPEKAKLQLSRAESAAKLSHPHLIRLFQLGLCRLGELGLLYLVMEYAEEDLSQVIPSRPLTPAEAHEMLVPVVEALAYVHGEGFVHGHLKPANILVVSEQLKISSDRLCRIGEANNFLWKPSVYDPPEVAGDRMSPARDVWGLTMTLVEALTQRLPTWEGAGEKDLVLPATLPPPFLDIARNGLQKDPQRRWTVDDIAAQLQRNSSSPRKMAASKPHETFARRRYVVPVVALGSLLAGVVVGPRFFRHPPETDRDRSVPFETGPQPKSTQEPATLERGRFTQRLSEEGQGASPASSAPAPPGSAVAVKTASGGLVPGKVVRQVLPEVPQKARNTIQGKVRVRVRVSIDPSGAVVGAKLDSAGTSRYFAELALQAAQHWKFAPAKVDGRNVSSAWILRFEFGRTATEVHSVRAAP